MTCEPAHAYVANGVVVHNCAYRMDGYTTNELFALPGEKLAKGHNNPVRMIPYDKVIEILQGLSVGDKIRTTPPK